MRRRAPGQLALDLDGAGAGRTATEPPYLAEPHPPLSRPWLCCGRCGDPLDWCDRAHRVQHCPPCAAAWGRERLAILGADGNPAPPEPPVAGWHPGWPALCDRCGRPCGEGGCPGCAEIEG